MTPAEALSRILREPISNAELASVDGDTLVFNCTPPQRLTVKITNRMLELRSDRRLNALFVARRLYEPETKVLLKLAQTSGNGVSNAENGRRGTRQKSPTMGR